MIANRFSALRRPLAQQFSRATRTSLRLAERPSWQRTIGRRGYADSHGGHGHKPEGSDIPWAVGAGAATVVGVGWVMRNGPTGHADSSHGEHGEHGEHDEHEEGDFHDAISKAAELKPGESANDESANDESDSAPAECEEGGEGEDSGKSEDKSEDKSKDKSEDKSEGKEESKGDEKGEDNKGGDEGPPQFPRSDEGPRSAEKSQTVEDVKSTEGAIFKGPGKNVKADVRKYEDNPKGDDDKKRIDSAYRKPQGVAGDPGSVSNQQKGVSNVPTMHSTDQMKNPDQSKKPEGAPDTAKLTQTIDPNRGK